MSKLIILVIAGAILYFLLRRSFPGPRRGGGFGVEDTPRPEPPKNDTPEGEREEMVYDEMCKSYIGKSNAITLEHEGKTHYFCSGLCRQTFINSNQVGPY